MRYRFYREHKYVSAALNDVERDAAKTDFTEPDHINQLEQKFENLVEMLEGHAEYENTFLHSLLKQKGSSVFHQVEHDHNEFQTAIMRLRDLLHKVKNAKSQEQAIDQGYLFYLWYRKFVGDNLIHLHEEETVILPELQRLYSDEELRGVEAATYRQMTAEQMIEMISVLFVHMNPDDHAAFLYDLKQAEPEKYKQVVAVLPDIIEGK